MIKVQPERIDRLVLAQLAHREMRLLTLTVSVRKALTGSPPFKGDLSRAVTLALRRLVATRSVLENDGVYSLVAGA